MTIKPENKHANNDQNDHKQADNDQSSGFSSPPCLAHELERDQRGGSESQAGENLVSWRKQQRSRLKQARDELSDLQHAELSRSVSDHLSASTWLERSDSIGLFWPMRGEIDLRPLIRRLIAQGVTAALPVITKKNQALEFWQWVPSEPLSDQGLWGIPVPAVRRLIQPGLLLVPMLGFDDEGHRLGFGGGYYDRTIAAMTTTPVCLGVCAEYGHMQSIYPQSHDVPMHAIASESQFRVFNDPVCR